MVISTFWCGPDVYRIRLRTELGGRGSSAERQPLNIGHLHGGGVNWVVAHPLLLRWDGLRWAPRRAMKTDQ
ncbi:MAG: hypothetical protein HA492_04155 [Candidatus Verstraetearchaeota archaeon]|nr:hypothetical protein [Candidatus Verstraetearchaeota archaeon]